MSFAQTSHPDTIQHDKQPKAQRVVRWPWIMAGVCLLAFAVLLPLIANFYYANAQASRSDSFDHPIAFSSDKLKKELRAQTNPDFDKAANNFEPAGNYSISKVSFSQSPDANPFAASVTMQSFPVTAQATPTPADAPEKKKNVFRKIYNWFTGLFRKKKPPVKNQPSVLQTGKIKGIISGKNGIPQSGVTVTLMDMDGNILKRISTNSDGSYEFTDLMLQVYKVEASVYGKGERHAFLLENAGETILSDFSFEPDDPGDMASTDVSPTPAPTHPNETPSPTPTEYNFDSSSGDMSSGPPQKTPASPKKSPVQKEASDAFTAPDQSPMLETSPTATPEASPTVTPDTSPSPSASVTTDDNKPKYDKVEVKYPQRVLPETEHEISFSLENTDALIEAANTIIPANNANAAVNVNTVVRTEAFSSIRNKCKDCTVYARPRLEIVKGLVIVTSEPLAPERVYDGGKLTWVWKVKTTLKDGEQAAFKIRLDFELRSDSKNEAFPDKWDFSPDPIPVGLPKWIKIAAPLSGGVGMIGMVGGMVPRKRRREGEEDADETDGEVPLDDAGDEVHATIYAPAKAKVGSTFKVEVFAHLPEQAEDIKKVVAARNHSAVEQDTAQLDETVGRGSKLTFSLRMMGMETDESVQTYVWKGAALEIPFIIFVPKDYPLGESFGKIIVSQDSLPIGRLDFTVEVVSASAEVAVVAAVAAAPPASMKLYQSAFISYSSSDRPEVLKRVQMLKAQKIPFFQDMISLNEGDRWEKELYKNIDDCDVVYLFWSEAAKNSKWVMEEVLYAHGLENGKDATPPDIIPIPLEGPPVVAPPEELSFLHFNDEFIYLIYATEAEKKAREH